MNEELSGGIRGAGAWENRGWQYWEGFGRWERKGWVMGVLKGMEREKQREIIQQCLDR